MLTNKAYEFCCRAFKVPRSIVSDGNIISYTLLEEYLDPPIKYIDIPSGTDFNGWTVPNNWNLKAASLLSPEGKELIDLSISNLQVVVGSKSVETELTLSELLKHIHSRPDLPQAIPYVTSYYAQNWGFCLPYQTVKELSPGIYKVRIEVDESPGVMRLGEILIEGEKETEVFFSTYFCHPQMANNELSGPAVWITLANLLWRRSQEGKLRNSYRFYIGPETIGAIHYLSKNYKEMKEKIIAGYVLTCVGTSSPFVFMPSREGNTLADRTALFVLRGNQFMQSTFAQRGSDERHWCSPAMRLPVCSIMTKKYYEYPEYHTSLDNIEFISAEGLQKTTIIYERIINILEDNQILKNTNLGEPKLDRFNLYPEINSVAQKSHVTSRDVLNILNLLDGEHDTLKIAEILNLNFDYVSSVMNKLLENGVITE